MMSDKPAQEFPYPWSELPDDDALMHARLHEPYPDPYEILHYLAELNKLQLAYLRHLPKEVFANFADELLSTLDAWPGTLPPLTVAVLLKYREDLFSGKGGVSG